MIKVYIREQEQISGQLLGEFPLSEIQQLIEMFQSVDTFIWDDPNAVGPCGFYAAQFASDETGAYMEMLVVKYSD